MRLLRAAFHGVRGVPDGALLFGDPATGATFDVAAITGPAASGKTRALEAILAAKEVLAPYGAPQAGAAWLRPGEARAKVELDWVLDEEERGAAGVSAPVAHAEALFAAGACRREIDDGVASVLERYEHDPRWGKIEYLPARRALVPLGAAHGLSAAEQRMLRAGADPRKYAFVPRFVAELSRDPAGQQRFAALLAALSPTARYAPAADPLRAFTSRGGPPVLAHELSSSEADAVLVAATACLLHLERSVVLVDGPERNVPEASVADWALALRAASGGDEPGRGPQLVLATSSPVVLSRLDPRAIASLG